jgi:phosphatidylglycerol:prolipoprotein diacylglycerol transferase
VQFPIRFQLGPLTLHAHWLFESLAYFIGFRLYLWQRKRAGDVVNFEHRMWVAAAAIAGAALGSKVLNWFADPHLFFQNWRNPYFLMSGKTVVGGLIGGLFAVEWAKLRLGITARTGDLFALPLCLGIAIGRIGCFLSGLEDDTYGVATALPWGVDFGDGVRRHPTQLYEIVWLALLALWIYRLSRRAHRNGDLFKTFMTGYFVFRLAVDFIKPGGTIVGLTGIQWACVGMLIYYARDIVRLLGWQYPAKSEVTSNQNGKPGSA